MTNAISLGLLLLIAAILALDATVLHLGIALGTARLMVELIEYVSFWR